MYKSILYLIESKNRPVFDTPMVINYSEEPQVGHAFWFNHSSHLSVVQSIKIQDGFKLVTTLNSTYILYPLPTEVI